MPRHATPRHATPRHATPRHATPSHPMALHGTRFGDASKPCDEYPLDANASLDANAKSSRRPLGRRRCPVSGAVPTLRRLATSEMSIGCSNNHVNNLHFKSSPETQEIATRKKQPKGGSLNFAVAALAPLAGLALRGRGGAEAPLALLLEGTATQAPLRRSPRLSRQRSSASGMSAF